MLKGDVTAIRLVTGDQCSGDGQERAMSFNSPLKRIKKDAEDEIVSEDTSVFL